MSKFKVIGLAVLITPALAFTLHAGQIQNPIKAAKDAYNKAKQQQQQQQQGQQGQQPSQQQTSSQPANSASQSPAPSQPAAANPSPATAGTGSAAGFSSSEPPDFYKLPDMGGAVRVGLTHEELGAAELKIHPGFQVITNNPSFNTLVGLSSSGKPPFQGLRGFFGSTTDSQHDDTFFAYYTMPPAKQQTFTISRRVTYPLPGIDRAKLVAALRQKYGPETKAIADGVGTITSMYWVYDEQGHFIASDKGGSGPGQPPFNCRPWGNDSNIWGDTLRQYRNNELPPAGFCDTVVMLSVDLGGGGQSGKDFSVGTTTEIDDRALLRRDVQVAGDTAKADSQKQQQQQIDKSKQAVPSL
jgi:hypothetical protein